MASANISDDWQLNKTVLERNMIMLERQLHTDITFVFGDVKKKQPKSMLKAHKYMLISSSPVFSAMLTGGLAKDEDIVIEDVEYEAFAAMLRFIYCEEVQLTGENAMAILYASKKYLISSLSSKCTKFLDNNLDVGNVCIIMEHAINFGETSLVKRCLTLIKENTDSVFKTQGFLNLAEKPLGQILSSDDLSVPEIEVYQACIKWAKTKDGTSQEMTGKEIRVKLGDLLFLIRFPTMTASDFSSMVSPTGVLTEREELACFRYICSNAQDKEKPTGFNEVSRKLLASPGDLQHFIVQNRSYQAVMYLTFSQDEQFMALFGFHNKNAVTIKGVKILCEVRDQVNVGIYQYNLGGVRVASTQWKDIVDDQSPSFTFGPIRLNMNEKYKLVVHFNYKNRFQFESTVTQKYVSTLEYFEPSLNVRVKLEGEDQGRVFVTKVF